MLILLNEAEHTSTVNDKHVLLINQTLHNSDQKYMYALKSLFVFKKKKKVFLLKDWGKDSHSTKPRKAFTAEDI